MKTQSLLAAGWFAAVALGASSLSAADARLQHLTDQLRGRTARLMFETAGLFGDASNFRALERHGRAMHDTAESLARTAGATIPSHEHLDKDLATLAHYRVQFGKECDVLARELRGLWGEAFADSFVLEDLRLLFFRLDSIQRLGAAIDRHVHPGRADEVPVPADLSSRPGTWCPADLIPWPDVPGLPLPMDPRPVDPLPADPAPADPRPIDPLPLPGTGGAGLGPAPIPDGVLPPRRIPDGLVPSPSLPRIPRPDLGSLIPPPGTGTGSGSGSGSGSPGRIPGIPRDRLLPGVGDSILGSRPGGGSGGGTGVGLPGGTLIPGSLGGRGIGGIRIPLPGR